MAKKIERKRKNISSRDFIILQLAAANIIYLKAINQYMHYFV